LFHHHMYLKNNMFTFQGWILPLKCSVLYFCICNGRSPKSLWVQSLRIFCTCITVFIINTERTVWYIMKVILTSTHKNKFSHVNNECVNTQQIQNPRGPDIFYLTAYSSFYKYTKLLPFIFCGLSGSSK